MGTPREHIKAFLNQNPVHNAMRLVCFDMDGVIFPIYNFWFELHKAWGTIDQGQKLTEKFLHSDYQALVQAVVINLWQGKDYKTFISLVNSLEYNKGVKKTIEFFQNKGFKTAIVTTSSKQAAQRVQKDFDIDFIFYNELEFTGGKVRGPGKWPMGAGKSEKAGVVKRLCKDLSIQPKDCIFIGDSRSDIGAFKQAGLAIAFNPKDDEARQAADIIVESEDLFEVTRHTP